MSMLIEKWCTHKIANFEGIKSLKYIPSTGLDSTLEALDGRIRVLERLSSGTTLPPMLKPTWDSLEYRIRQLDNRITYAILDVSITTNDIPRNLEVLRLVASNVFVQVMETPLLAVKTVDEFDVKGGEISEIHEISQRLCYLTGRLHHKIPDFEENPSKLYDFAIALSLHACSTGVSRLGLGRAGPGIYPHSGPGIPMRSSPPRQRTTRCSKSCCSCCDCSCHGSESKTANKGLTKRDLDRLNRPHRRVPGFGWLSKLWCFGSNRRAGSDSTGSSDPSSIDVE